MKIDEKGKVYSEWENKKKTQIMVRKKTLMVEIKFLGYLG